MKKKNSKFLQTSGNFKRWEVYPCKHTVVVMCPKLPGEDNQQLMILEAHNQHTGMIGCPLWQSSPGPHPLQENAIH